MNCRENEKYLAALVDNEVALWRKIIIKMHLAHCEYCRKMVMLQAQIKQLLHSRVQHVIAPQGLKTKIQAKLEKEF